MIIELFLIGQLLSKRDSVDIPTVVDPPPKDYTDYDPQGTYGDKTNISSLLPDAPKPIFEVDPVVFADVIKLKRFF